jgi:hypothetical protein
MSAATHRIELRLRDLAQLFNLMDPSPFYERDLDADAEEFIVGWAHELPREAKLELVIHLATPPQPDRAAGIQEAVRHYFEHRAEIKGRELRQLLRRGRGSFFIGIAFLAVCFFLGLLAQHAISGSLSAFIDVGLQIAGWVAMWRPLEIFLYDWWPIRNERRLMERLAGMPVTLVAPPA